MYWEGAQTFFGCYKMFGRCKIVPKVWPKTISTNNKTKIPNEPRLKNEKERNNNYNQFNDKRNVQINEPNDIDNHLTDEYKNP